MARVLPALRARRAAARGEAELQRHLLLAAQLQSSRHYPHGWSSPYDVYDSRWFEGESSAEKRTLSSPRSLPSSSPRLRQSSASWFVVEYGARALHHIGTVLKGLAQKGPIFDTRGFPVALIRLAIQSHLHQRRVLSRCRCGEALGRRTRRQTMMPSSDAACSAHGEQRGGSVRRLMARRGGELASSPVMPRRRPSMMPSL